MTYGFMSTTGASSRSEDGDAGSLRVECSSSDGDDEENSIDLLSLRFENREEPGYDFAASSSNVDQTPSTSSGSVNVNATIKVSLRCWLIFYRLID